MNSDPDDALRQVYEFVDSLAKEDRMLLILKQELYEGSWDEMVTDLNARLGGKPYVFKLANRIEDDLERIDRLRQFELQHSIDLSDFVSLES